MEHLNVWLGKSHQLQIRCLSTRHLPGVYLFCFCQVQVNTKLSVQWVKDVKYKQEGCGRAPTFVHRGQYLPVHI